MSVYLRSAVVALGLTDASVVHDKGSGWAVAAIPVQLLIEERQVIARAPDDEAAVPHPCAPAHALVHGDKKPKKRREHIAAASPLVYVVP